VAVHAVELGANMQAPVPLAHPMGPQAPLPVHAAVQQLPAPLAPHAPLWQAAFDVHAAPAASCCTQAPLASQ
jgi:hypothetical protein